MNQVEYTFNKIIEVGAIVVIFAGVFLFTKPFIGTTDFPIGFHGFGIFMVICGVYLLFLNSSGNKRR